MYIPNLSYLPVLKIDICNVEMIAYIGKTSEIKKEWPNNKNIERERERDSLNFSNSEMITRSIFDGTRKSLKITIGCQYELKNVCITHV